MKGAYYNDNDPFCAEWLRRLIAAGAIPAGEVDERSIADIEPGDLRGFAQCHFFAGIGGWAYALALAGWDRDRPVWTGSCPCQPFSSAGRQGGATDERHLWPWWLRLIGECRPDAILGEQVEGAVGFGWVDRVSADLEAEGYAIGAAVLGAHSVGAPHIRQRLFWVADAQRAGVRGATREDLGAAREVQGEVGERQRLRADLGPGGASARCASEGRGQPAEPEWRDGVPSVGREVGGLADADAAGSNRQRRQGLSGDGDAPHGHDADGRGEADGWVGYTDITRPQGCGIDERAGRQGSALGNGRDYRGDAQQGAGSGGGCDTGWLGNAARGEMGRARQPWQDSVWLPCLDGKARRVVAALQPLAHAGECICGLRLGELCACGEKRPSRVGMLRGSGNAIAPAVAAEFIRAVLDCLP